MRKTCLHDRKYNVSDPRFGDKATASATDRYINVLCSLGKSVPETYVPETKECLNAVRFPSKSRFIHVSIPGYTGHRPSVYCETVLNPTE
jgi:hypothetical protein